MQVGLDATPLLGARTGIGRYVLGLLGGIAELSQPPTMVRTYLSARLGPVPPAQPNVLDAPRRFPARLLHQAWRRTNWPPVEMLAGHIEVFHGTNYVLPPMRRATGVLTIHDLSWLHHAETVARASLAYRDLVPRGLRRAAVVVVDAQVVGDEVVSEYGIPRDRLVVAPLGVGDEWLHEVAVPDAAWLAERGLPERYLLFVGSREPRKNLPILIEAYRELRGADPSVPPLALVGPPGWGPMLDASGLPPDAFVIPGYLGDEDLPRVVAGAALLAFPSRYEGFGLPPLEALAVGTPVVASDLPVLRETLGEHATYAPVGDADALAAAIARVLAAPPDPSAGRAHAGTFTWRRCAEATVAAYHQALNGHP